MADLQNTIAAAIEVAHTWGKENANKQNELDNFKPLDGVDGLKTPVYINDKGEFKAIPEFLYALPLRKSGSYEFADVESFAYFVNQHKSDGTSIFGSYEKRMVVAILNGDKPKETGDAGHKDHKAVLKVALTPDWTTWTGNDKQFMNQSQFAEFLEENAHIIVEPESAKIAETILHMKTQTDVKYESKVNPHNGDSVFSYSSETTQVKGTLVVPTQFTICIYPFRGSKPEEMLVRLRWRNSSGNISFSYIMDRPDRVLEEHTATQWEQIKTLTDIPVLAGP